MSSAEAEWLWGWDPTPGIVSVHAEPDGRAVVWRRVAASGALVREDERFRPWLLVTSLDDFRHLGTAIGRDGDDARAAIRYRELEGPGALRYLVSADDGRALTSALLHGASRCLNRRVGHLGDLPDDLFLGRARRQLHGDAGGRHFDVAHEAERDDVAAETGVGNRLQARQELLRRRHRNRRGLATAS